MHHPRLVSPGNHRFSGTMVGISQTGRQPDVENLGHPFGDAGTCHGNVASNLSDGFAGMVAPENLTALSLSPGDCLGATQALELLKFLRRQDQFRSFRLSSHARSI